MMSIGLHCRLIGRPGRLAALQRFMTYIKGFEDIWVARRIDIATHWHTNHPPQPRGMTPSQMDQQTFVGTFGGIFEHSPWIAERAHGLELSVAHDGPIGVHSALCRIFRTASESERHGVLTAHPDLAGKLAQAKRLTAESTSEQASAGLDALTDQERDSFTQMNTAYVEKFGFPFIIAVRDHTKASILAAFRTRLTNSRDQEFAEACTQVERIALHRLTDLVRP